MNENCIFCKIISGEIPSKDIYSDEDVFVILDINPAQEGHCLVMPKEHYQILPQMPDELIKKVFSVSKKISQLLLKSLSVQGTSIFVANGAIAGQRAPHFMAHVIPRHKGDMLFEMPKKGIEPQLLGALQEKLSAKLGYKITKASPVKEEPIPTVKDLETKDVPKDEPHAHKEDPNDHKQRPTEPEPPNTKADLDKISELFK